MGKNALVTGASRGIGRAIALELARQGHQVVGTATTEAGASVISKYFEDEHLSGFGVSLDVTRPDSIEAVMQQLKEINAMPDILVNNAAVTRDNILLRMKDEEWQTIMDTNLSSVFRLSRACLKNMVKARWGRIINISSVVGTTGNPGQANYAAAKAGVIGFSKSLAIEIATRGITVNVVSPGFMDTDMTQALSAEQRQFLLEQVPMGTLGKPDDVAYVVAFLASDKASYITGQTMHVNGGMLMV